jgi:hypothetical protein
MRLRDLNQVSKRGFVVVDYGGSRGSERLQD